MARLIYSAQAFSDLQRITDFLREREPAAAPMTMALVAEAVQVLENHPRIGRVVETDLRELIISQGRTGYVALYSYESPQDTVLILAIRHQREAGYLEESEIP